MKTTILLVPVILFLCTLNSKAQRITVSGTKFLVEGKEIVLNGANTPWNSWNDFGGNYKSSWWDAEFQKIKNAGGNCTRIWISCNGEVGLTISSDGTVTGSTAAFWAHLADMFQLAKKNKIYIKATLISFDHFKNSYGNYQSWRNMVLSDEKVNSFIDKYVHPFVSKFKDNPYLWSIDVCNEIEWVNQNAECGQIPWNRLQYLVARVASAVHDSSSVLVTLGSGAIKWNSPKFEGNFWSDASLKSQYNKSNARLDFYSPLYYGWVVKWFGNFALDKTPADYGINDRPCVIGENPAKGVFNDGASPTLVVPASEMFIGAYKKGWKGLMPWTSNGVDSNGSLKDFESGLKAFQTLYPALIDPSITTGISTQLKQPGLSLIEKVYSNPGTGQFTIELNEFEDVHLKIFNIEGKTVFTKKVESSNIFIPGEILSGGIYLLSVYKYGKKETVKIYID